MRKTVFIVVLVLMLTSISKSFDTNANPETILHVDPQVITVNVGEIFSVNVSIQDVTDLYEFHLCLGYHTTVLDALYVYVYPPFNNGPIIPPVIDEDDGYVEVSGSVGLPGLAASGSFPLAKITLNATAPGNSALDLYNTDLHDSMSNSITHLAVDGAVLIYPHMTHTDFTLEVTQVQCDISRENGIVYFKMPTSSLFGPNAPTYDDDKDAVWVTSTNITYGDLWGSIETFNGVMILLNTTGGSALLYDFPLDVGGGFKGLGLSSCTLDDEGNVWIAIGECFWTPEEIPESIPSLAKLYPESNTLNVFWLPKEFGWVSDVKFHDGSIWCQSEKYLVRISGGDLADFWEISDDPSFGYMHIDGDHVWITRSEANEVKRFDILNGTFDVNFTGLSEPLGICGDAYNVFVAEGYGASIMVVNKSSLQISHVTLETNLTFLCKSAIGNLWWTSPNSSIGVIGEVWNQTYNVKCKSSGPIVKGSNDTVWFSGRNYCYYLGPPYVTCTLYICVRNDIKSPDINKDSVVNMRDITEIILDFNAKEGEERYKPQCDIDGDGIVNMRDIVIAILNFNRKFN